MKIKSLTSPAMATPQVVPGVVKVFAAYSGRLLRRRFHAIRILKNGLPPHSVSVPLVVYLNHAAWWDPLVCLLLARQFFGRQTSFAPIDASALERYAFFKKVGFYGVEQNSARGALSFVRTTRAILGAAGKVVWLTPQGRFMDVRERPLRLQGGIGVLAGQLENAVFLPLAIEYSYWTEPRPEILISFGEPLALSDEPARTSAEWTQFFSDALEATQDELAARSCRRDPAEWRVLEKGASGVNVIYDAWRRFRARLSGAKFDPEHHAEDAR